MQQATSTMQSRIDLAAEIGRMETEISKRESTVRELEQSRSSAKGNRTAGALVLLVGVLGFLFLFNLWYLWIFLGLIGLPTLVTAISNQNAAEHSIKQTSDYISTMRGKLAEKRAMLAIG